MVFHQRQVTRYAGKRSAGYPITRYGGFKRSRPSYSIPARGRGPNARSGGYAGLELKFHDYFLGPEPLTTDWVNSNVDPGAEECLNALTQGTGENERIGRAVNAKGIFIRGSVHLEPENDLTTMPNANNKVRIVLVLDTQTNQAAAIGSEVMDDTFADRANSFKNLVNNKRFKILGDKTITMTHPAGAGDATTFSLSGQTKHFTFFKKLNFTTTYNGTSETPDIAQIVDNSLHIFAVSDAGAVVQLNYQARFRFTG